MSRSGSRSSLALGHTISETRSIAESENSSVSSISFHSKIRQLDLFFYFFGFFFHLFIKIIKQNRKTSLPASESSSSLPAALTNPLFYYRDSFDWLKLNDITEITNITFRDSTAAAISLQFHCYLDGFQKNQYLQFLLLMLEANPRNKKVNKKKKKERKLIDWNI